METIKTYLENTFSGIPKSAEINKLKSDILNNMEDKYYELKNEGKTENEVIGIVISEFGNIDELINELGLNVTQDISTNNLLEQEEVLEYLKDVKSSSFSIGIGVVLCMIGIAILITFNQLVSNGILLSTVSNTFKNGVLIIPTVLFIIPAVALFIYSGFKLEKYKYLKKNVFEISLTSKIYLESNYTSFKSKFTKGIIVGVCICIFSSITIFLGSALGNRFESYSISLLLILVSIAVFIFIKVGMYNESLKLLLKKGEFSKQNSEADKFIGTIASVVWPLVTCVYLLMGFIFNLWNISWVVFPIAGILFGAFTNYYKSFKRKI